MRIFLCPNPSEPQVQRREGHKKTQPREAAEDFVFAGVGPFWIAIRRRRRAIRERLRILYLQEWVHSGSRFAEGGEQSSYTNVPLARLSFCCKNPPIES